MTEPPVLEIVIPLVEFERLHAEVAELRAELDLAQSIRRAEELRIDELHAEKERLEGLVERRDAEIVRLGNAWDECLAAAERLQAKLEALLSGESKRLKREVDYWMSLDAAALEAENDKLRAEVERLSKN